MANTTQPLSEVAICNFAAHVLDEDVITSLDDTSKLARFCALEYGYIRDELLRMYPWAFAKDYRILAPDATPPPGNFKYSYTIPTDWLRVFPPKCKGQYNAPTITYEKVQNKIWTDEGPQLLACGTLRVVAAGSFDPLYARALGMLIALRGAENITGKSGYTAKCQSMFDSAMTAALLTDSLERGTPETVENDAGNMDAIAARGIC